MVKIRQFNSVGKSANIWCAMMVFGVQQNEVVGVACRFNFSASFLRGVQDVIQSMVVAFRLNRLAALAFVSVEDVRAFLIYWNIM